MYTSHMKVYTSHIQVYTYVYVGPVAKFDVNILTSFVFVNEIQKDIGHFNVMHRIFGVWFSHCLKYIYLHSKLCIVQPQKNFHPK